MRRTRFEDSFDELWALAYKVAYRMTGSRPQAEDVAQATMERAFGQWRQVHGHSAPWVVRVATNLVLDLVRREDVASRHVARGVESPAADHQVDVRAELRSALAELPDRQRSVVVLRHLYGYSVEETAQTLGITGGSVKTHSHRAIAALRDALTPRMLTLIGEDVET